MIAVIDYDAGNIRSVLNAMKAMGQEAVLTDDRETILGADRIILPGVGAFGDAMGRLKDRGLVEVIRKAAGEGTLPGTPAFVLFLRGEPGGRGHRPPCGYGEEVPPGGGRDPV